MGKVKELPYSHIASAR